MTGIAAQQAAVALAVTAAISFAVANVVQQRVAARLDSAAAFDTAVLFRLARRPAWLAGLATVLLSLGLQATALGLGRLVVIEPVLASSLLFALALGAFLDGHRMRPVEWLAALATVAGLAMFLVASEPSGGRPLASTAQLSIAAAIAAALVVAASLIAVRLPATRRALALGVGGGVAAGVTDALTKSVAGIVGARQFGIVGDPRLYLLIAVGLATYTMQQNGYRAAGLAAFLPVFSVLDPAVGSLLGLLLYHERLGGGPGRIALEATAVLVAGWGIARLASSTTSQPARPAPVTAPSEPLR